jgi:hypothetical protein
LIAIAKSEDEAMEFITQIVPGYLALIALIGFMWLVAGNDDSDNSE